MENIPKYSKTYNNIMSKKVFKDLETSSDKMAENIPKGLQTYNNRMSKNNKVNEHIIYFMIICPKP